MLLKKLSLENYGVYFGKHTFDFSGNTDKSSAKNIIVVKGANGAGKSTLFNSLGIGIFGRCYLPARTSKIEYEQFILNRFHHHESSNEFISTSSASVSLELEIVLSGVKRTLEIERIWKRNRSVFTEDLMLRVDGDPPEVEEEDYETWLLDIFPVGLNEILSFDAEDMKHILSPSKDSALKVMIKRLLGLHIVEQLQEDLKYYLRTNGAGKQYSEVQEEVLDSQKSLDQLSTQIDTLNLHREDLLRQRVNFVADREKTENELSSIGGDYASKRSIYKQRIIDLSKDIDSLLQEIQQLASGLLPFLFAPKLLGSLTKTIDLELERKRKDIASKYISEKIEELSKSTVWDEFELDNNQSSQIIQKLAQSIGNTEQEHYVHGLAEHEVVKLKTWIHEIHYRLPELVHGKSEELKEKKRLLLETNGFLNRAPVESDMQPLHKKIKRIQTQIQNLDQGVQDIDKELAQLEYEHKMLFSAHNKLYDKLHATQKNNRAFKLAEQSQKVLLAYQKELATKKIRELEYEVQFCFNRICQKDHLLNEVHIDLESFQITMKNGHADQIGIDDFSAGESQLFSLSLLWAMRKISGFELPLIIDTPIARLDKKHRASILTDYLPSVSNQVLLFTTNVEMNNQVEKEIEPFVSTKFELIFNKKKGYTQVHGDAHKQLTQEITTA